MAEKTFRIKLDRVELLEKTMSRAQPATPVFNFQIKAQSIIHREEKTVITFIGIAVKNESSEIKLAEFLTACGFIIENFEEVIEKDEQGLDLMPVELDNTLKSISISTTRGIIYSELRGTALHGAYLPIILADSLQPTDEKFIQ